MEDCMKRLISATTLALCVAVTLPIAVAHARQQASTGARIEVVVDPSVATAPLDGRMLLVIARTNAQEPRFTVGRGLTSEPLFGIDVEGLPPGTPAAFDGSVRGWPIETLAALPAGDYWVQAVLNVYTTFHRADGHTIKAHMDQWEGQRWNRSPGNLYSEPQRVHVDPASASPVRITLTKKIPPIDPPADTAYVKHVKFKSDILSRWWGHDMYLGAVVVLPEGFAEHPNARFPVAYNQGHFPATFRLDGQFLEDWKSGRMGRFIMVLLQHPTPFYDDSYAVNSENNGPYGDALTQELVPRIEKDFRAIAQPWARVVYGGSTGGWESLAWQVFYPDLLNGTWTFCPDPVDFRYFQLVNLYQDKNAFFPNSPWKTEPVRPWQRTVDDQVAMSERDASHLEEVLGTHGRSGDQMDIFNAVFGPVGGDGYPKPVYDKWTGAIDPVVAQYWKEHYDLRAIMERDWKTLGPKLQGKLHLYVGEMDSYYLEEAAFLLRDFLTKTSDPKSDFIFEVGERAPHCYAGKPEFPGQRPEQRVFPQMLDRILKTAPPGADVKSWRY
jgi:putative esterase